VVFFCIVKSNLNQTFVEGGFREWKNATAAFEKHSESACHRETAAACAALSGPSVVDTLLCVHCERQQATSSDAQSTIISSVTYLTRQGLAMRGHDETSGNFRQLLALRSHDVKALNDFLKRPKLFTSHDIQNE